MVRGRTAIVCTLDNGGVGHIETLQTIAERFGVHASTVSRALRMPRKHTANPTTLAIRKYSDKVGFRPNATASSLRTNRTHTIGVLAPTMLDSIHAEVFEGVDGAAIRAGYSTMLAMTSHLGLKDAKRADTLVHGKVDGIIVQDTYSYDALPDYLQSMTIPFVLTLRRMGKYTYAAIDDWFGGAVAAEHLLRNSPRSQVIISPAPEYSTFASRISGFQARWAEHRNDEVEVVVSGFTAEDGRRTARKLLERAVLPESMFVCNDQTAAGVMVELWNNGYRAGEDFALVGFNDIEIASLLPKPMTTIASPLGQLGRASVDLLLDLIDGGSPASVMFTPALVERESSTLARR